MTTRLIYAFDPLCGWCYGFAPALRALRQTVPALQIDLRMGGLVTGERIRPYIEAADYITMASTRLKAVTGVALGEAFKAKILTDPAIISSSVPPCDVVLQVRQSAPDRVYDVAEAIQIAHFRDGLDLNDPATYAGIMRELDIEIAVTLPAPKEVSATLAQEFAATRALGLTSYPSLLMGSGSDLRPVDLTYDPEVLVDRIEARLTRA
jgi:putative protein-disulfide isomerase